MTGFTKTLLKNAVISGAILLGSMGVVQAATQDGTLDKNNSTGTVDIKAIKGQYFKISGLEAVTLTHDSVANPAEYKFDQDICLFSSMPSGKMKVQALDNGGGADFQLNDTLGTGGAPLPYEVYIANGNSASSATFTQVGYNSPDNRSIDNAGGPDCTTGENAQLRVRIDGATWTALGDSIWDGVLSISVGPQ